MTSIPLGDRAARPTSKALAQVLGPRRRLWDAIAEYVKEKCPAAIPEWKFPGVKYGWSFRLKDRKRNLVYLTPMEGFIRVALVLGDKAVAAVEASSVPEPVKAELRSATRYVEGRGIRLEVRTQADVATVKKLVDIKLAP